jgi:hypothetical protein
MSANEILASWPHQAFSAILAKFGFKEVGNALPRRKHALEKAP